MPGKGLSEEGPFYFSHEASPSPCFQPKHTSNRR